MNDNKKTRLKFIRFLINSIRDDRHRADEKLQKIMELVRSIEGQPEAPRDNSWKKETCQDCFFRSGSACRKSPPIIKGEYEYFMTYPKVKSTASRDVKCQKACSEFMHSPKKDPHES